MVVHNLSALVVHFPNALDRHTPVKFNPYRFVEPSLLVFSPFFVLFPLFLGKEFFFLPLIEELNNGR
jgi:hypothetical protein